MISDFTIGVNVWRPGVKVWGNVIVSNSASGVLLQSSSALVGGVLPEHRNMIEDNEIGISDFGAGNMLQNNIVTGSSKGVRLGGDSAMVISNVLSANTFGAVVIASRVHMFGNIVGADPTGERAMGNLLDGICLYDWNYPTRPASSCLIGATKAEGSPNLIAYNGRSGIIIVNNSESNSNRIGRNSIFANGSQGIDLIVGSNGGFANDIRNRGVTSNDFQDIDIGPNSLQNFPLLGAAVSSPNATTVIGELNSRSNSVYLLEFFATPANEALNGQGKRFLGELEVNTDAAGTAKFTAEVDQSEEGEIVTATATDSAQNSSEFSDGIQVKQSSTGVLMRFDARNGTRGIGEPVTSTVSIGNYGLHKISGLSLRLTAPTSVIIQSAELLPTSVPGELEWSVGSLEVGESQTAQFSLLSLASGNYLIEGKAETADGLLARASKDIVVLPFGSCDPEFVSRSGPDREVRSLAIAADGSAIVAGSFLSFDGSLQFALTKVRRNGTLDPDWNGPRLGSSAYAVITTAVGEIFVGGSFEGGLLRLRSNGSLPSGPSSGLIPAGRFVYALAHDTAQRVLVGGQVPGFLPNESRPFIARIGRDGLPDETFVLRNFDCNGGAIRSIVVQQNGRILVGGTLSACDVPGVQNFACLRDNGSIDSDFSSRVQPNGPVYSIALLPDAGFVIGGDFTRVGTTACNYLARFNSEGVLDTSFGNTHSFDGPVYSLGVDGDGSVWIGGSFQNVNGGPQSALARLLSDGTIDSAVSGLMKTAPTTATVYALGVTPFGGVIAGGNFQGFEGCLKTNMLRLTGYHKSREPLPISVDAGRDAILTQGEPLIGAGSFRNVGSTGSVTGTINYGDGTADTVLNIEANNTFSFRHVYAAAGKFTVAVNIVSSDGRDGTDNLIANVEKIETNGEPAWPMFQHDLRHTGQSPYKGPEAPELQWAFEVSGRPSSPAIGVDGTIYQPTGLLDADTKGFLYAITPSGGEKWRYEFAGLPSSTAPAVAVDGTIYVHMNGNEGNIAAPEKLYAISAEGTLKWLFLFNDGGASFASAVQSSPAIGSDGTIYVGSNDTRLYAISPDGTLKWRRTISDSGMKASPAIANDGNIYITDAASQLATFTQDGTIIWTKAYASGGGFTSGYISIGTDGTLYLTDYWADQLVAVNPDGSEKWRFSCKRPQCTPAIASDGTIYAGADALYAINPDGTLKWKFGNTLFSSMSPVIDSEGVIYWRVSGGFYAVNKNGLQKWYMPIPAAGLTGLDPSPAIGADGTLYVPQPSIIGSYLRAYRNANQGTIEVSVKDVHSVREGTGNVNAVFMVTLSSLSAQVVAVNYATADGTAVGREDYVATNGTLIFAPGETSKEITVPVKGNLPTEANETFFLNLSGSVNAIIADGQAVGTIVNDDTTKLSISDATVTEGNSGTVNAVFTVTLSSASVHSVTVNYATAYGTAVEPGDYTATSGTLTFAAGETSKTISVPVKGDLLAEANETFFVNLSSAINATLADDEGVGTIFDEDRNQVQIVTPGPLPTATLNVRYETSIEATSGVPPYLFSLSSGAFPPGLAIAGTGLLSGAPTAVGSFRFRVRVTDAVGGLAEQEFLLTCREASELPWQIIDLGVLPGRAQSVALDINDSGEIVGFFDVFSGMDRVW